MKSSMDKCNRNCEDFKFRDIIPNQDRNKLCGYNQEIIIT